MIAVHRSVSLISNVPLCSAYRRVLAIWRGFWAIGDVPQPSAMFRIESNHLGLDQDDVPGISVSDRWSSGGAAERKGSCSRPSNPAALTIPPSTRQEAFSIRDLCPDRGRACLHQTQ